MKAAEEAQTKRKKKAKGTGGSGTAAAKEDESMWREAWAAKGVEGTGVAVVVDVVVVGARGLRV